MKELLTGVVLAGGHSERMGQPKPLLMLGGKLMLARVADTLKPLCRELVLVVRQDQDDDTPDTGIALGMHVVTDTEPERGPVAAIHAGLRAAVTPLVFITGADHPFLSRRLIAAMATASYSGGGRSPVGVIPRREGVLHVTHAVLPVADWLPVFTHALESGANSPKSIVDSAVTAGTPPVAVMTEDEIEEFDPQLLSLFDVDTPDALATARRIASSWGLAVRPDVRPSGL